jgi:hypothetical protein
VSNEERLYRELRRLVEALEPLEKDGRMQLPGIATLNGARLALQKSEEYYAEKHGL